MAYEERPNSGSLFKNDKGDNPKRPDYTGKAIIDGVEKRIAGWIKSGAKGNFLSLSFSDPRENSGSGERRRAPEPDEGDIPFGWLLAVGLAGYSAFWGVPWT